MHGLDIGYLEHAFLQQPYMSWIDCAELLSRFHKQYLAFIVLDCWFGKQLSDKY